MLYGTPSRERHFTRDETRARHSIGRRHDLVHDASRRVMIFYDLLWRFMTRRA